MSRTMLGAADVRTLNLLEDARLTIFRAACHDRKQQVQNLAFFAVIR